MRDNNWMPGAVIIASPEDGGSMLGGTRKVVWHTTENDPAKTTAVNVAKYLQKSGNGAHLIWHPVSGEIVQMIPANRAGRALENRAGGVETNRAGFLVIQIEVVGRASVPFTSGPMNGLLKIMLWLASLGVPAAWVGTTNRSMENWARSGHFGHVDVPENNHTDPGRIDTRKLMIAGVTATKTSIPKPLPPRPAPPTHDVPYTVNDVRNLQFHLNCAIDGVWGEKTDINALVIRAAACGKYFNTFTLQRAIGVNVDGVVGPATKEAIILKTSQLQRVLRVTSDGHWGDQTNTAFYKFRNQFHK